MARSIRLRLQLWYAAVLMAVTATAAGVTYVESRTAKFDQVDTRLRAGVAALDALLRTFPPHELDGDHPGPPDRPPPDDNGPPDDGPRPRPGPPDGGRRPRPGSFEGERPPRPGPFEGDRPPGRGGPPPARRTREQLYAELELRGAAGAEVAGDEERPYFAVWREDGSVVKASDPARAVLPARVPVPGAAPAEPLFGRRGTDRTAVALGPRHTTILVGKPVGRELAELTRLAWQLAGGSALALAVGLAGGWWVSARVLRPVAAIAATASSITATRMSQRIDTSTIDQELVGLAEVLNETFGRLEAAFERQVRFTADASHELRTPLAVLYAHAELALSRSRSEDEYRDALRRCLQAAARMRALVDGLLTLARADAGKLDLARKPVDLGRLAEEVVDQHGPPAERAKVILSADVPDQPVVVSADAPLLSRVAENLVANALRHVPPGGRVTVGVSAKGRRALLTVTDTGSGIGEADRPRIFERFFRADKARSRASGGSGLGLAICKSLVEAHGGTIRFTSRPGIETTFVVELPCG
jgi:heavy metal sensor kinase